MNTRQGALAILCAVLVVSNIFQTARGQKSELQCEHQYCRATGTVGLDNETYPYTVASGADYQLIITLKSTKADVDLSVASPHRGGVKTSSVKARNSRKDVVVFSPKELQEDPGVYSITVVSNATVESDYTLDIQQARMSAAAQQLHKDDAAALKQVFEQCCEEEDSCPTLRKLVEDGDTGLCEAAPNRCNDDGHLTHLALSSEGLECKFPKAVSKLKSLTRLDFTFNQLDGSVEDDVAPALEGLTSLEHLSLGFNELDGELSCGLLGPEKKLHELDLAHNEIEGSIPECLLSSSALQELYLANNALSGSLPTMFEDVPLTTLSVADQKGKGLSGELPSFTHAQGLTVLRLNGNSLTGQLPELPSTVQEIRVQNNELHGSIPRGYGFLKQLHTFKAEENKLSGGIPSGLAGLQNLQIVDLSLNRLTGTIPSSWEAPKLVEMDLHSNALSGGVPGSLALLPRLSYLQLQDNELNGDLSAYAAALSGLELPSATRFFSVGGNQLTGVVSAEFQKLGAFLPGSWNILDGLLFQKTLNLSQNAFGGQLPTWALHSMSGDTGLTAKLAGNKWACPGGDSIDVCSNLDEVQLGDLKCVDEGGLTDSATSRYAVIDLLRVMPTAEDCPEQELEEGVADFKVSENGQLLPGFKVHFSPTTEGMALEDFNGQEIWDAAWGETDYDGEQEQDDDEEGAPWGLTDKRVESFPELPEEEELKEKEEDVEVPRGEVDLPDWAPGHKVKSSGDMQQDSRPGSDVDLPDWAPGHKVPSRYSGSHPGQTERKKSYHWAQDASRAQDAETLPDARHDTSARKQDAPIDASPAAEQQDGDVDHGESPAQGISLHLPDTSAAENAAPGSKQGAGAERAEADGDRTATMLLAAFAVVLGVCVVLGGLGVWKVYRQRQGPQYEGLAMEAGMAGLELQKSTSGSDDGLGGHERDTILARKSPIINLQAKAGGDVPADVAAYKPPPAL